MSVPLPLASMPAQKAAQAWTRSGASVLKIRTDGTKRPATEWKQYTITAPTLEETTDWFGNGHPWGLAVIMGAVSGNLELCEIEGVAATDLELMRRVYDKLEEHDAFDVWHIVHNGYLESSPTGGLHFIYRVEGHPVPGNEKIARRPATEWELADRPGDKIKVLAETRGEGGYVIVAPTSGRCHPSGRPWELISGEPGVVPTITWDQRNLLHRVLHDALDAMPAPNLPAPMPAPRLPSTPAQGLSPGDDFENRTTWEDILQPSGWTVLSRNVGGETHWVRPGKRPGEGMSATTGRASDRDRLYVFSTSTEFDSEVPYTKFGAYALLNFGGDHSAAARELVRLGFGDRPERVESNDEVMGRAVPARGTEAVEEQRPRKPFYRYDDDGNAQRLWDRVQDRSMFVEEYGDFVRFDGKEWVSDFEGNSLHRAFMAIKEQMYSEAAQTGDEKLEKWAGRCGQAARRTAAVATMRRLDGVTVRSSVFDENRHLLNVANGVLDPVTRILVPHAPEFRMNRTLGAAYDPDATAPTWDKYLRDVLPDESMRRYLQRAVGYTLLGKPNRRALFFLHGPGGTGKSTFMETMQALFAGYGSTAAPGTFRAKKQDGPTPDLHRLRGKRFVSTSETAEGTSFEEDLLKRMSGGDTITSRDLYQGSVEWKSESTIWFASNHPPRFTSDDDAIWQRAKMIPFVTRFSGDSDDQDMTAKLIAEVDGIFNWVLDGVREFLAVGLEEPEEVQAAVRLTRQDADPVQRFVAEKISDGNLILEPEGEIGSSQLYEMYVQWARTLGDRPLGHPRFRARLESSDIPIHFMRKTHARTYRGIRIAVTQGVLGTM